MSRTRVITLPKWDAALASAGTTPARSIWLGTSTVQGSNATDLDFRYHQITGNKLTRIYNNSKYIRYYTPQADLTNTYTSYFTFTDGSGSHSTTNTGLSLKTVTLTNTAEMSITVTGSAFTVYFVEGVGYNPFTVLVDGVGVQITPSTSVPAGSHTGVANLTGYNYGAHTLDFQAWGAKDAVITGVAVHGYASGDPTKGVYVYNSGHGGFTTTDFVGQTKLFERINFLNPQLITYMPGTNDYGASMDIPTYSGNVDSIMASLKLAAPNADLLLITPYRRLDITGSVPWISYRNANQASAVTAGCWYIDLTDKYPASQAVDQPDYIDTDGLHQTNAGHSYASRLQYGALV